MNVLGLCPEGALKHVAKDVQFYKIYKSAGIKSEAAHVSTRPANNLVTDTDLRSVISNVVYNRYTGLATRT